MILEFHYVTRGDLKKYEDDGKILNTYLVILLIKVHGQF